MNGTSYRGEIIVALKLVPKFPIAYEGTNLRATIISQQSDVPFMTDSSDKGSVWKMERKKIFSILYPPLENSTTPIAITFKYENNLIFFFPFSRLNPYPRNWP